MILLAGRRVSAIGSGKQEAAWALPKHLLGPCVLFTCIVYCPLGSPHMFQ